MKFIVMNGPSGSGKDYGVKALQKYYFSKDGDVLLGMGTPIFHVKFSAILKKIVSAYFQLDRDAMETVKDTTLSTLYHTSMMTPREAQIALFNQLEKLFGPSILGLFTLQTLKTLPDNAIVFSSDGGRNPELLPIVKAIGAENVLIIHVTREGYTFEGDIRYYVEAPGVTSVSVENKGDDTFATHLVKVVNDFLGVKQ